MHYTGVDLLRSTANVERTGRHKWVKCHSVIQQKVAGSDRTVLLRVLFFIKFINVVCDISLFTDE